MQDKVEIVAGVVLFIAALGALFCSFYFAVLLCQLIVAQKDTTFKVLGAIYLTLLGIVDQWLWLGRVLGCLLAVIFVPLRFAELAWETMLEHELQEQEETEDIETEEIDSFSREENETLMLEGRPGDTRRAYFAYDDFAIREDQILGLDEV